MFVCVCACVYAPALYEFVCLQKRRCLCTRADDSDSGAVSAERRSINFHGFTGFVQVLTADSLAGARAGGEKEKKNSAGSQAGETGMCVMRYLRAGSVIPREDARTRRSAARI